MNCVLSLDLGGTSLRAATADPDHPSQIIPLGKWPAPTNVDSFASLVDDLCARATSPADLRGVGIAVPGLAEGTTCRWVPNLAYLDGVDVAHLFRAIECPVVVANDAQLALLAEVVAGRAQDLEDALLLSIGTGIGSAVLAAKRIIRGAHNHACSFGWACADLNDSGADRLGWLERTASGRAIDRVGADLEPPRDGAAVVAGARRGEPACVNAIDRVARTLAIVLAGAVSLLDPSMVLLTGGVSEAADLLVRRMRDSLSRHLPPRLRDVRVEAGAFGTNAGLVGAAIAAAKGSNWWNLT
jgi:glucokinase